MTIKSKPWRALLLASLLTAGSASVFYAARVMRPAWQRAQAPNPAAHKAQPQTALKHHVTTPATRLTPAQPAVLPGDLAINKSVVAGGGGGPSNGAATQVEGTAGQSAIHISSGGAFTLSSGFWPGAGCQMTSIAPVSLADGTAGLPYNQVLTAPGAVGTLNFALTAGPLPLGLTLSPTGVLAGIPNELGAFNFSIKATDMLNCVVKKTYSLKINCPTITFSPPTLPNGVQGTAYNQTLAGVPASPTHNYVITTGALPPGLSLNSASGAITGTPTASGNYAFGITVTGWAGPTGSCTKTQSYNVLIIGTCATLTIGPTTLPTGTLGLAYPAATAVMATGGVAPYVFNVSSGALPPGLALNANTGAITGTPTQAGSFVFTIRAVGQGGCAGSRTYVVPVACATLSFNPPTLPNGAASAAYNQLLTVNPAGTYTFNLLTGSLPPGLTLSSAGLISGITSQAGTYSFTVKASAGSCQATKAYTLVIGSNSNSVALALSGDYDGDGKADPVLWSESEGIWRIAKSSEALSEQQIWGMKGDVTLLGDYDGDHKTDLAVFRPAEATFYIKRSSNEQFIVKQWGLSTDMPVPGDYDGDGRTDIAVWRGATGTWYIVRSSDGQYQAQAWGAGYAPYSDVPVGGDYDGDGQSDLAVFRRGNGTWLIKRSSDGQYTTKIWGLGTDVPVAQDYDGDGKTDVAVWRPSEGIWYIWQSATGDYRNHGWGLGKDPYRDQAAPDDYDGDGQADLAVWRATDSAWYIKLSGVAATKTYRQGLASDSPVQAGRR